MPDTNSFKTMNQLDKEKFLIPFILTALQEAGGQLERQQIKERICAKNDDIADWADEIRVSKRTNVPYSQFKYKFNFAIKNLLFSGFVDYRRGDPMVFLTKKGLNVEIPKLDVDKDVYDPAKPKWEKIKETKQKDSEEEDEDIDQSDYYHEEFKEKLLDAISKMSPKKFESFSRQLLGKMGVQFTSTGVQISNDGGIDGYGYHRDMDDFRTTRVVIQCKRYNNGHVGSKEIDMFLGAMSKFQADYGIFITNSRFTTAAVDASRSGRPITLIDGNDIVRLVEKFQLHVKPIQTYELLDYYNEEE